VARRLLDLLVAAPLLVVSAPLLLLALIAIRLETPGRPLIAQQRVGRDGVLFECFKLRTMHRQARLGPTHEISGDMVTALGRVLRRTGVDELPQLWNVIRGEMSLIGPRPCLPLQRELIELRRRYGVLALRPGISGLAQVFGVDMAEPEVCARIDALYLKRRSMRLDLGLLVLTPVRRMVPRRVIACLPLGARAGREDGSKDQHHDQDRISDVVADHQPRHAVYDVGHDGDGEKRGAENLGRGV